VRDDFEACCHGMTLCDESDKICSAEERGHGRGRREPDCRLRLEGEGRKSRLCVSFDILLALAGFVVTRSLFVSMFGRSAVSGTISVVDDDFQKDTATRSFVVRGGIDEKRFVSRVERQGLR